MKLKAFIQGKSLSKKINIDKNHGMIISQLKDSKKSMGLLKEVLNKIRGERTPRTIECYSTQLVI